MGGSGPNLAASIASAEEEAGDDASTCVSVSLTNKKAMIQTEIADANLRDELFIISRCLLLLMCQHAIPYQIGVALFSKIPRWEEVLMTS